MELNLPFIESLSSLIESLSIAMAKFEAQELKHSASELELPFIESLSTLIESLSIARPKIEA